MLAAPPTQYGISQNYFGSDTAYGEETTTGRTEGNYIGIISSSCVSYGLDMDFGIGFIGFEGIDMKTSRICSREMLKTNTVTSIMQLSNGYATGSDHDSVVFQLVIYECFQYQIVSHPYNSSLIGQNITLIVPNSASLHQYSVSNFNEVYGDLVPEIGNETFTHTIGRPWTYPSKTEIGTLAPNRWQSSEIWVGQGSGWTEAKISVSQESIRSLTRSATKERNSYLSVLGGYSTQKSHGSITGNVFEIIIGDSCVYEGAVGHIEDETIFNELEYSFGLVVYYQSRDDGSNYQVVNYWVANAIPYDPPSSSSTISNDTSISILFILSPIILLTSIKILKIHLKKKKVA